MGMAQFYEVAPTSGKSRSFLGCRAFTVLAEVAVETSAKRRGWSAKTGPGGAGQGSEGQADQDLGRRSFNVILSCLEGHAKHFCVSSENL
jgi:hypothetical protein